MAKSLAEKLRYLAGKRVGLLNAPDHFKGLLGEVAGVEVQTNLDGQFDVVHLFVTQWEQAETQLPALKAALKGGDSILWVSYPKGGAKAALPTDLNRDILFTKMQGNGLEANQQIAIDEVWSALRFKLGSVDTL